MVDTASQVRCYGLSGGSWQGASPKVRVSTTDGSGAFCLLIDGSAVPDLLCARMLDAAEEAYGRVETGSSDRLREAVTAANQVLFEHNLRADASHRVLARLSSVSLEGSEACVVLLGDAGLVGIVGGRTVATPSSRGDRKTGRLPWLAGVQRTPHLDAYRSALAPDDVLVLSTRDVIDTLSPPRLLSLLSEDGGLPQEGLQDDAAMIVIGDAAAALRGQESGSGDTHPLEAIVVEAPPEQLQEAAVESGADAQVPDVVVVPPQTEDQEDVPAVDSASEALAPQADESGDAMEGTVTADGDGATEQGESPPPVVSAPKRRRIRVTLPKVDVGSAVRTLGEAIRKTGYKMEDWAVRVLPDKVPERPSAPGRTQNSISVSGRVLVVVAMAIPLVMLAVVIATRIDWESRQKDRFGDIQAVAQSQYDAAMTSENIAARRQGLYDTLATTEEGLAIEPGDEMLMSLKRNTEHQLDQINAVDRIYTFYKLAELEDGGGTWSSASRIVVQGIDLFVLNRGSDRVYQFLMNDVGDALQPLDSDPMLLQTGDIAGGATVGEIVDMTWMRAGGQRTIDTFVVLDRTGTMYAYDPQQGIDALPVADSDTWMKPEAIGGYYGNLYVLDPLLNVLLKYVPTDNAYTNPPTSYLNPSLGIDLTGAVDMAIDGNVYVLYAGGEVAKFYDGEPVPFTMSGMPSAMNRPSAIFVSGEPEPDAEGYVYVADTGNQRVLQFDKGGQYVRQLRARIEGEEMQDIRGLYVDEETERILLVSGNGLWYAKLPSVGAQ